MGLFIPGYLIQVASIAIIVEIARENGSSLEKTDLRDPIPRTFHGDHLDPFRLGEGYLINGREQELETYQNTRLGKAKSKVPKGIRIPRTYRPHNASSYSNASLQAYHTKAALTTPNITSATFSATAQPQLSTTVRGTTKLDATTYCKATTRWKTAIQFCADF